MGTPRYFWSFADHFTPSRETGVHGQFLNHVPVRLLRLTCAPVALQNSSIFPSTNYICNSLAITTATLSARQKLWVVIWKLEHYDALLRYNIAAKRLQRKCEQQRRKRTASLTEALTHDLGLKIRGKDWLASSE